MEIIKKTDPSEWKKDCTCNSCKSVMRVNTNDLLLSPAGGDQRDSWDGYFYFTCPVCRSVVTLSLGSVPSEYHHTIKRK